ncbi:Lysophospholipid acyltransferase 2 [Desmophyllum pertusum]|uniref:Lysophospholipid acyltransferase 2 n=1 Tax=Desmophyllum pertusum TaxID=174260 RepID=A0A9W9YPG0_9CNID|nr:Lysophospholipid acyltransferase 2 [Desmophyllum pertusum]
MFYIIQTLLLWVSKLTKGPDQVQFVFCMFLCFPLGAVYRTVLHPRSVSPRVRLAVSLAWGFMIGWICIGSEMIGLIVLSTLYYGLTWSVNPKEVHKVVFAVSFFCLSAAHIARMFMNYGENKFDYHGRLMIITQKVTYVAFCLHDGSGRKKDELTKEQTEQSIVRVPSLLEYFGYMFHHSMLLAGPVCTFNDYMDFIEGRDIARATDQKTKKEPNPTNAVLTKLASSLLCGVLFSIASKIFPFHLNADPFFIANSSFLLRIVFAYISMFVIRLKFYFAWIIGNDMNKVEAPRTRVINACGLGFNGYDSNGRELWNRITNVNALEVEKATSFRQIVINWNIQSELWLRRTIYARVPYQKLLCTLTVSTIWHGFYPAYLLTVSTAGILMLVTRKVRRTYGHLFCSDSPVKNSLFVFLEWFVCQVVLTTYCFTPFVFLRVDLSLTFYRSTYFIGHLILIGGIIICLGGRSKPSHDAKGTDSAVTSQDSRESAKVDKHKDVSLPGLANNNALHRFNRKLQ